MEKTVTLESRTGNESLSLTVDPDSSFVRLHAQHVDEFDGDEDYWVTLGEFSTTELAAALLPPLPACRHAACATTPTARPAGRGK